MQERLGIDWGRNLYEQEEEAEAAEDEVEVERAGSLWKAAAAGDTEVLLAPRSNENVVWQASSLAHLEAGYQNEAAEVRRSAVVAHRHLVGGLGTDGIGHELKANVADDRRSDRHDTELARRVHAALLEEAKQHDHLQSQF